MLIETMKDVINFAADTYQDAIAFSYKENKEIANKTYNELKADSEAFSCVLQKLNMVGKHVGVIGATSYPWVTTYFGTVNSQSVIVPIDALLPAEDVCQLLNRADISVLVFDTLRSDVAKMAKEKCPNIEYIISMQEQTELENILCLTTLQQENQNHYNVEIDKNLLCAILFTSGTTGKSKGVMLTHKNLTDNATCFDMKIKAGMVSMTVLPIHHAYCFTMDILKGIYCGLHICINDSIMRVSKNIKLFKPDVMLFVPLIVESVHAKLVAAGGILPKKLVAKTAFGGNLKTIYSGGAYLNPELIDEFAAYGIEILQGYGMTECSPVISTNLPDNRKNTSVGKLIPNCEAKVVDEEIWVRGSSVMMGYYKMPEETAEALQGEWLKTGDLGYVDDDFVFITGRKKNLIILANGENVSPEEIENELCKSAVIKEIIVKEHEGKIKAEIFPDFDYVQKKRIKDIETELQKIIDGYNANSPVYKRVYGISIRQTEFEKTPSKKIKRNQ